MGKPAFRCNNCGRLEDCGACGPNATPHACRICGKGVKFCPATGRKTCDYANWEVLAQASDERLAELGLSRDGIESHDGKTCLVMGRVVERSAEEAMDASDKSV